MQIIYLFLIFSMVSKNHTCVSEVVAGIVRQVVWPELFDASRSLCALSRH